VQNESSRMSRRNDRKIPNQIEKRSRSAPRSSVQSRRICGVLLLWVGWPFYWGMNQTIDSEVTTVNENRKNLRYHIQIPIRETERLFNRLKVPLNNRE
jgi:hypothetical protein